MADRLGIGRALAVFALVGALWSTYAARAEAQFAVRGELDAALLMDSDTDEDPSVGMEVGGFLGYGLDLTVIAFVPEIGFTYGTFADTYERDLLRLLGGARLTLPGAVLQWSLVAHIGYGTSNGVDVDAVLDRSGLTFDVGGALDITLLPIVFFGAHLDYGALLASTGSGAQTAHILGAGLHVGISL